MSYLYRQCYYNLSKCCSGYFTYNAMDRAGTTSNQTRLRQETEGPTNNIINFTSEM